MKKKEMNEEKKSNKSDCQNQSVNIANLVWKANIVRMRRTVRKYLKRKLLSLDRTINYTTTKKTHSKKATSSVAINTQHELQLYYLILFAILRFYFYVSIQYRYSTDYILLGA